MLALWSDRLGPMLYPVLFWLLVMLYHGELLHPELLQRLRVVLGLAAGSDSPAAVGPLPVVLGRVRMGLLPDVRVLLHRGPDDGGPKRPHAGAYARKEAGRRTDDADRAHSCGACSGRTGHATYAAACYAGD